MRYSIGNEDMRKIVQPPYGVVFRAQDPFSIVRFELITSRRVVYALLGLIERQLTKPTSNRLIVYWSGGVAGLVHARSRSMLGESCPSEITK